ncbi:adenylate kinase [Paenibacillus spongiae]|uniref:Adenylate kinase n=1 Tax=Paenibacillus spongiae TaxID=2909671 RepID=A0ABY5S5B3_9BACL|nr:adenylate kinase [Paenibacillus spongiae]UVI28030.1 adenylate kinase [Paenibacillus spongiae]
MNIILLGLPGAGKGTQAKIIIEHHHIPHISTGEILRQAAEAQTKLGLLAKGYMSKGELVPDEITIGIATNRLRDADCQNGFLLDGFPRNVVQAQALNGFMIANSKVIDHVIYVEVREELLLERLTGRRTCAGCGATYHVVYQPPRIRNQCDQCSGKLKQRDDDREATVRERLRINKHLTVQLLDYYKPEGSLRVIDGSKGIKEVTEDLIGLFRI